MPRSFRVYVALGLVVSAGVAAGLLALSALDDGGARAQRTVVDVLAPPEVAHDFGASSCIRSHLDARGELSVRRIAILLAACATLALFAASAAFGSWR